MTRTTLVLLTMLGALVTAVVTPASALNPQPLPPMPRCSPPCYSQHMSPTMAAPHASRHR
jgi:hypothetical protein